MVGGWGIAVMVAALVTAVVRDVIALRRYRVRRDSIERLAGRAGVRIIDIDRDGSVLSMGTASGAMAGTGAGSGPPPEHELGRRWP